jgi:hypothetical protein
MTTAGFRFIPIDRQVVEPPVAFDDLNLAQPLAGGSISGSLEITWTAETPVCIGVGDDPVTPIRIGGTYILPGASLRGMVRAVTEIATFSHLGHINAARHYGVRTYDQNDMPPAPQRHGAQDLKAGWLVYHPGSQGKVDQGEWRLKECQPTISGSSRGYWHVRFNELLASVAGFTEDTWRKANLAAKYDALITAGLNRQITWYDFGQDNMPGAPNLAKAAADPAWNQPDRQRRRAVGFLVCAGPTDIPPLPRQPKSREALFSLPASHAGHLLPNSFIQLFHSLHSNPGRHGREPTHNWRFWLAAKGWLGAFRATHDAARDPDPSGYTLYPGVPVFFHGDPRLASGEAESRPMAERGFFIGLTRVLRLPWPLSVGDVADRLYHDPDPAHPARRRHYEVPRLAKPGGWDFARALFGALDDAHLDGPEAEARRAAQGDPEALSGRVAFGPGFALDNPQPRCTAEGVFGTPRESYYPFYLARARNAAGSGTQRYDDDDAVPAGRKRYVVRRRLTPLPQGNANADVRTHVQFLPPGTRFAGKVRFHNLHPVELGALLWALTFGEWDNGRRYRHQIGRAKAQGYGVLRADIVLRPLKVTNDQAALPEHYLARFRDYMTASLGRDFETTDQIVLLRRYADPDVGDQNSRKLATLPLEPPPGQPNHDTYPKLKRHFPRFRDPGAGPILSPIE